MTGHISTKYGITSKACTSWCSTKEANDSLVTPTKEEEKSTSTPSAPAVDPPSSHVPEGATARNGHAHWLYFRVDEARAKMEHTLSTLELSIQIYQAIKIIRDNESGKIIIQILSKAIKGGWKRDTGFVSELAKKANVLRDDEMFTEAALCNMIRLD